MSSLNDVQVQFIAAVTGATNPALYAVIENRAPGVEARLAVYHNTWRCNLRNALAVAFPVVEKLVGTEFFGWMADRYIEENPSRSGNLDDYGDDFPAFIDAFPAAQSLLYLGDVARLEWLIDAVMAAPDTCSDDGEPLAVAQLFASDFPVNRIWQVNQPDWQGDAAVALDEGPAYLLVKRVALSEADTVRFDLYLQSLSRDEFLDMQNAVAHLMGS